MIKDISLPRNPVLAKLFRSVKLAENAGLGFDKMLKWKTETNTKIGFDSNLSYSILTFQLTDYNEAYKKSDYCRMVSSV